MLDFKIEIRNETYKRNDKKFETALSILLEWIMKKFNKSFALGEKIPIFFNLHDYLDEIPPLAMIEPNFEAKRIFINSIWINFTPSRWYFTTNSILEATIFHEGLHYKHQFSDEFKKIFRKYEGNLLDAICDIHLIPYLQDNGLARYEAKRMLIGRILNLIDKKNRIELVKNFCEKNQNKEYSIRLKLRKPSIYLLSILYYSRRYRELIGKHSKLFNSILKQIKVQDIEFEAKQSEFNLIFEDALDIKNGEEMEDRLLKLNTFKNSITENGLNFLITLEINFKKS